jgi:hypothetical protein
MPERGCQATLETGGKTSQAMAVVTWKLLGHGLLLESA